MKAYDDRVYCTDNVIEKFPQRRIDFGMRDAKGRAIGYWIACSKIEHVERYAYAEPGRESYGPICKPEDLGVWFVARTSATRNGASFGASTGELRARTGQDLEALIDARVEGARARYAKIGGAA